jgi:hypothetical protein
MTVSPLMLPCNVSNKEQDRLFPENILLASAGFFHGGFCSTVADQRHRTKILTCGKQKLAPGQAAKNMREFEPCS